MYRYQIIVVDKRMFARLVLFGPLATATVLNAFSMILWAQKS